MSCASPAWQSGSSAACRPRGSKRALEIVGVVFAFIYFWPLAIAYLGWKFMGYPVPTDLRRFTDKFERFGDMRWDMGGRGGFPFAGTGNLAFDEYRRSEIERLERERQRLDDEAREFRSFVEELKRAKDREEFDAYMAKRRQSGPTTA